MEYLNYDSDKDCQVILDEFWSRKSELVVFDEIHKLKNWKNKIKGIYDTEGDKFKMMITGSARLNLYQKTGDSLVGKYFHHRLYPLSYREVLENNTTSQDILLTFMQCGSFPEPFLTQSENSATRWRKQYVSQVLSEDVRHIGDIKDLASMRLLIDMLRKRVGSTLSLNSIARDLEVAELVTIKLMPATFLS